ncbi:MAG: FAD-binding oxidoreductase [Nitriliruptor sp.]|nr:MAG: FAD-binding oxidoreductase [Nitriliruptor sp.]
MAEVVGPTQVLDDPGSCAAFETDWTGRWQGRARAVVRPADTAEVAAVVTACADQGAAIVPQGGNTGLVGGSVPRDGEVVVSLTRLDDLGPVGVDAREVTVGAGATLAAVQEHAAAAGLAYGVDLAARDSATIGGTIATDAGGIRVVRYGATREQVRRLEVVLADGRIVEGGVGDGGGPSGEPADLGSVIGSEGTLALITSARLRLLEPPRHRAVALLAVSDVAAALRAQEVIVRVAGPLEASELVQAEGLRRVVQGTGQRPPFAVTPPAAVLVEVAGADPVADRLVAAVGAAAEGDPGVLDALVGLDAADRTRLWQLREAHTEALAAAGPVVKLDVVVPLAALAGFVDGLPAIVRGAGGESCEVVVFGHLGVGDLHVNLLGVPTPWVTAVEDAVCAAVVAAGGRPDGEHGVGVQKRAWVPRSRSADEVAAMRATARAFDPRGLLNPGVRLPG